jgi:hypothetical protein
MSDIIWPSELNVGAMTGVDSRRCQEYQLTRYMSTINKSQLVSFVSSGLAIGDSTGLAVSVAVGVAIIDGYWCEITDNRTISGLTDDSANWLYMHLNYTGSLASSITLTSNVTGVCPAHSACIGYCIAGGGDIDERESATANPHIVNGHYTGDAEDVRLIFLGFQPSAVEIWWPDFHAISGVATLNLGFIMEEAEWLEPTNDPGKVPIVASSGFLVGNYAEGVVFLNTAGQEYQYRAWA